MLERVTDSLEDRGSLLGSWREYFSLARSLFSLSRTPLPLAAMRLTSRSTYHADRCITFAKVHRVIVCRSGDEGTPVQRGGARIYYKTSASDEKQPRSESRDNRRYRIRDLRYGKMQTSWEFCLNAIRLSYSKFDTKDGFAQNVRHFIDFFYSICIITKSRRRSKRTFHT